MLLPLLRDLRKWNVEFIQSDCNGRTWLLIKSIRSPCWKLINAPESWVPVMSSLKLLESFVQLGSMEIQLMKWKQPGSSKQENSSTNYLSMSYVNVCASIAIFNFQCDLFPASRFPTITTPSEGLAEQSGVSCFWCNEFFKSISLHFICLRVSPNDQSFPSAFPCLQTNELYRSFQGKIVVYVIRFH